MLNELTEENFPRRKPAGLTFWHWQRGQMSLWQFFFHFFVVFHQQRSVEKTGPEIYKTPRQKSSKSLAQFRSKLLGFFFVFAWVIAWFVMIFGINTTSDDSKLLYVSLRAVRRVKFETILKYHKWCLCQISCTSQAIISLYNYPQKVCNFHM